MHYVVVLVAGAVMRQLGVVFPPRSAMCCLSCVRFLETTYIIRSLRSGNIMKTPESCLVLLPQGLPHYTHQQSRLDPSLMASHECNGHACITWWNLVTYFSYRPSLGRANPSRPNAYRCVIHGVITCLLLTINHIHLFFLSPRVHGQTTIQCYQSRSYYNQQLDCN